jgi:hypothetical protein
VEPSLTKDYGKLGSDKLPLKLRGAPEGHKFELQARVRGPGSFIAETTAGMRSILTIPRSVRRVRFSNHGLQAPRVIPVPPTPTISLDLGPPPGESGMKGTYLSFLIALTCLLIPSLIWVFATTQLFGFVQRVGVIG